MNKNYSWRQINNVILRHQHIIRRKIEADFFDKNLIAEGWHSGAVIQENGVPHCRIAISSDFFNEDANCVNEYDFCEAMIATFHECYHFSQYLQRCPKNVSKDNIEMEQQSYVSRCFNDDTYIDNYNQFVYEVAAERYSLHEVYKTLSKIKGYPYETVLLDYVNARMNVPEGISPYFIHTDTRIDNMQTVFKLFDDAYEKALETKKPFSKYKDDCVGKSLRENPALAMGFKRAKDGKEQTHFAATIVLDEHPELYRELRGISKSNYDIQIVKNARLRPIVVKERELPNIDYDNTENTGPDELQP